MKILIKNGKIVNPAKNQNFIGDILIENSVIKKMGENISIDADKIVEAKGLVVAPGLVDMHVHLRDPGLTYKEDIITGANAAAAGGVTSLLCMPNTSPVIDNKDTIDYILEKSKSAKCKIYISACITKGMDGSDLTDMPLLKDAGAIAFTDDGKPVFDTEILLNALIKAKEMGVKVVSHCEDPYLAKQWYMSEGEVSRKLGLKGVNRACEDSSTAKEIAIAMAVDAPLHICHVSTKGSAKIIEDARKNGGKITAETAPHYLMLTDNELAKKDATYRMNPPLRTKEDSVALINAIKDGVIEVIATDHAPHSEEEKSDFLKAPNGCIGMETSLSASYTALVNKGHISLDKLIELMSVNPAKIIGIDAGVLEEGKSADIVIFDENEEWTVDENKLHGKSKNAIFKGIKLKSKVKYTFLNGEIVFEDK